MSMKYFSCTASEIQNFNRSVIVEDHRFKKGSSASAVDVFLSHLSSDKETLPKAVGFLEKHGARVYIDKTDQPPRRGRGKTQRTDCSIYEIYRAGDSKRRRSCQMSAIKPALLDQSKNILGFIQESCSTISKVKLRQHRWFVITTIIPEPSLESGSNGQTSYWLHR